jgi:hypothetical protein
MNNPQIPPAADPWETGAPPKDGTMLLIEFENGYASVRYDDDYKCWLDCLSPAIEVEDRPVIRWAKINKGGK